ncbi:MAG: methyltransferase domain-containing protein [Opitutae bacterium]|nr:methyltransferase domain-containing protein [Opitutae bacterium]
MQIDEYRKLAALEDRMWYFCALHRRFYFWLCRGLPPGAASILDAGCGTGGLIKRFGARHRHWRLTGLDNGSLACALAAERTNAEIVTGSITALPFGDGEFDAVVSGDVVCQVADAAEALRECARCVRPGGLVLVNVQAFMWLWSYHDETCETRHRYTRPELEGLFRTAGLAVEFASYANGLSLPLIAARRKLFRPARPTSDVRHYPAAIEAGFALLARLEFEGMRRGWRLPLGSSVFAVGRKPPAFSSRVPSLGR